MAKHIKIGNIGEDIGARYMIAQGFSIRHSQWRSDKLELDLVVENEDWVVFVEVKTRSSSKYGSPLDSVDSRKQAKILEAADHYVEQFEIDKPIRFDVIAITMDDRAPTIEHYEEAF